MTTARPPLTARQERLLTFMIGSTRHDGRPPTLREMMVWMKVASPHGITCHLKVLARKGYVENVGGGKSHSWRVVREAGMCPCCGRPLEGTS